MILVFHGAFLHLLKEFTDSRPWNNNYSYTLIFTALCCNETSDLIAAELISNPLRRLRPANLWNFTKSCTYNNVKSLINKLAKFWFLIQLTVSWVGNFTVHEIHPGCKIIRHMVDSSLMLCVARISHSLYNTISLV